MCSKHASMTDSQFTSPLAIAETISVAVSRLRVAAPRGRGLTATELLMASSRCLIRFRLSGARGRYTGNAAEHRSGSEPRAAGIIEIEQTAHQFAGGIESADRLIVGVEHFRVGGDAQAAKGESHAAGHRISFERRLIDGICPVTLVDRETFGAAAILDVWIERNVRAHRPVVFGDGSKELRSIDAVEPVREVFNVVGDYLGDLPD